MPPALILVSGPQGSGKTTFSVKIGKELGIPVFNKVEIVPVKFLHCRIALRKCYLHITDMNHLI